jgi:hypothetical protein
MAAPYAALISQVYNNATNNARLPSDLNREQVADEFMQLMAKQIRQTLLAGKQVSMTPFCSVLPRLNVKIADFTQGGLLESEVYHASSEVDRAFGLPVSQQRQYVELPRLMNWGGFVNEDKPAIEYLGPIRGQQRLKVYTGNDYIAHAHRKSSGRSPFAWIQGQTAWLFSPTGIPWTELTCRCVLADFRQIAEFNRQYDEHETPFPAPDDFVDDIVMQLVNRYISMYGRYSGVPRPNDGNHLTS